jgi:hypothetical protein
VSSRVGFRRGLFLKPSVQLRICTGRLPSGSLDNYSLRSPSAPTKRGRPCIYTPDVTAALHDLWVAASEICGELLHPVIADYVAILQRDDMWKHGEETTHKLLLMSEGLVKLRVGKFSKASRIHHGVSATKPSQLKELIPISTGPWKNKPPGYGQFPLWQ